MADYLVTDTQLTSIANAIRTKGDTLSTLSFPTGFVTAINNITTGGGATVTGSFAGSGTIEETISCDFEPDLIYIYGDLSGSIDLRGVVSIIIIKDTTAQQTSDTSSSSVTENGQYVNHNIAGYNESETSYLHATYSNGALTISTGTNTTSNRFNSSVTYSYILGVFESPTVEWTDISSQVSYVGTDDDKVTIKAVANGSSVGSYVFIMITCDNPTGSHEQKSTYFDGFFAQNDSGYLYFSDMVYNNGAPNEWLIKGSGYETLPWFAVIAYII